MVSDFLSNHYELEENQSNYFKIEYTPDLVEWALIVPNTIKDWHFGVKADGREPLLAFISGTPRNLKVDKNEEIKVVNVNFMCVHTKLRNKRLACVLMKELKRRAQLLGYHFGQYSSEETVPHPFSQGQLFHRQLNPYKNLQVNFSSNTLNVPIERYCRMNKLCDKNEINIIGKVRLMQKEDFKQVYVLMQLQSEAFKVCYNYSLQEIELLLLPKSGVVYTLVVENEETKKITEFISFYGLPNKIL